MWVVAACPRLWKMFFAPQGRGDVLCTCLCWRHACSDLCWRHVQCTLRLPGATVWTWVSRWPPSEQKLKQARLTVIGLVFWMRRFGACSYLIIETVLRYVTFIDVYVYTFVTLFVCATDAWFLALVYDPHCQCYIICNIKEGKTFHKRHMFHD